MRHIAPYLALLPLFACGGLPDTVDSGDPSTGSDLGSDSASDTEPDTDTATEPPPPPVLRFIALGDAGTGDEKQYGVASAIEAICARPDRGCDFALHLGDNIYNSGVTSPEDPLFQERFELPYQNLDFPFFVTLGNHDLGGSGIGISLDPNKAQHEVDYTMYSTKWVMPDEYYAVPASYVARDLAHFWSLNTTELFFSDIWGTNQDSWFDNELATSSAPWRIAFGHHPYISNGTHGNAGTYDELFSGQCDLPLADVACGKPIREFFDAHVCGQVDVYFSGHDHNRQWLGEACGTTFIVSGAAGKNSPRGDNASNTPEFEEYDIPGFVWVEIEGDVMTGYFYGWVPSTGEIVEDGPFTVYR